MDLRTDGLRWEIPCKGNELIASGAIRVCIAERFPDGACHRDQHLVTCRMSFLVIEFMQTIRIKIDTGKVFSALFRIMEISLIKTVAVLQSRQKVSFGKIRQFLTVHQTLNPHS